MASKDVAKYREEIRKSIEKYVGHLDLLEITIGWYQILILRLDFARIVLMQRLNYFQVELRLFRKQYFVPERSQKCAQKRRHPIYPMHWIAIRPESRR